ncbi:MAG: pyridoxal phosphate biosynthetic protein [Erythrobacter cryptus]
MNPPDLPPLSGEQKRWALAAAGLFLLGIGFLGFALSNGVMQVFAVGWVMLMIFGFVGAIRVARGDFAHPLFKAQVMLHLVAIGLLVAVIIRAFR